MVTMITDHHTSSALTGGVLAMWKLWVRTDGIYSIRAIQSPKPVANVLERSIVL
jgi:hypothetical protein